MKLPVFTILSGLFFVSVSSAVPTKYELVQEQLQQIQNEFEGHVSLFDLGENDTGQIIQGLRIGDGPKRKLIVGAHHGNEYGSVEVALAVARSLAEAPHADSTIDVIPVLNVSGYNSSIRRELGVDPNRDYPGPCGSASGGPFLLKSTQLLAEHIETHPFVMALTLHTYSQWVLFPWSVNTDTFTADQETFKGLAEVACNHNQYVLGTAANIMYIMHGNFMDFAYWRHGIWSFLFELGTTHWPSSSQVSEMIEKNVPAIKDLLLSSPERVSSSSEFTGLCPADLSLSSMDQGKE